MGIRDSFRRARDTVADSAAEAAASAAASQRAALDRAKTTTDKAAKAVTPKTTAKGKQ